MHAHTRRIHDLATTCTACTCCPTYANLLEPPCSIKAFTLYRSTNQIIFPPDREIPLVHLQSANQILFLPVREIRLVRMHLPAFTPITLCTTGRHWSAPVLAHCDLTLYCSSSRAPLVLGGVGGGSFPHSIAITLRFLPNSNQLYPSHPADQK